MGSLPGAEERLATLGGLVLGGYASYMSHGDPTPVALQLGLASYQGRGLVTRTVVNKRRTRNKFDPI